MEPVTEYKLCKRGHDRSPENIYPGGNCKECARLRRQTPECKEYDRSRRQTLAKGYVIGLLKMKVSGSIEDLVEIKRLTIQLKRSMKNGNQI